MASQKILLALTALACLVVIASTQSLDDELETVYRSRRAAQGVLRGYSGYSRRGSPLVFVGGYAANTRHAPRYAAPSNIEEQEADPEDEPVEEEEEPVEDEQKQQDDGEDSVESEGEPMREEVDAVEDEEEQEEEPTPVVKANRGYPARPRPSAGKPNRPQKPVQEEEEEDVNSGRGGVTAIASSVSYGKGANSKSQAIAYGARISRGQYRYRY